MKTSQYNVCGAFAELLNIKHNSLEFRLHSLNKKMDAIPAHYEVAKAAIKNPTLEHTARAISQNLGAIPVFEKDLLAALSESKLSISEKT